MSTHNINKPAGKLESPEKQSPEQLRYKLSLDASTRWAEQILRESGDPDALEKKFNFQRGQFLTRLKNAHTIFQNHIDPKDGKGLRAEIDTLFGENMPKPSPTTVKELNDILNRLLGEVPEMDSKVDAKTPYLERTAGLVRHQVKGEEVYHYMVTKKLTQDIDTVEAMMKTNVSPEQLRVLQEVRDMLIVYGQQDRWTLWKNTVIEARNKSFTTQSMDKMLGMTALLAAGAWFAVSGAVSIAESRDHPEEIPKKMLGPLLVLGLATLPVPGVWDGILHGRQKKSLKELNVAVNHQDFRQAASDYMMEGPAWREALNAVMKKNDKFGLVLRHHRSGTLTDAERRECAEALIRKETDATAHENLYNMLGDRKATEAFHRVAIMPEKDAKSVALDYVDIGAPEARKAAAKKVKQKAPNTFRKITNI